MSQEATHTTVVDGQEVDTSHLSDAERAALAKADGEAGVPNPSLEDIAGGANPSEGEEPNNTPEERPSWLDPRFKTPEDMAKSLKELESKLGSMNQGNDDPAAGGEDDAAAGGEGEEPNPAEGNHVITQADLESFSETLRTDGELSAEQYADLEKRGYSKEMVDVYVDGILARSARTYAPVYEQAGGEEAYNELVDWAAENLDAEHINALNPLIQTGGQVGAQAIKQLQALQAEASGEAPNTIRGKSKSNTIVPFESQAEVTRAMRDPRYKTDTAYQAEVARRMAISDY